MAIDSSPLQYFLWLLSVYSSTFLFICQGRKKNEVTRKCQKYFVRFFLNSHTLYIFVPIDRCLSPFLLSSSYSCWPTPLSSIVLRSRGDTCHIPIPSFILSRFVHVYTLRCWFCLVLIWLIGRTGGLYLLYTQGLVFFLLAVSSFLARNLEKSCWTLDGIWDSILFESGPSGFVFEALEWNDGVYQRTYLDIHILLIDCYYLLGLDDP